MTQTIERERQAEQFQFRLQTQTNLLDDEIVRLNEFLLSVQAEIADAKDQYQRLSITVDQRKQENTGKTTRSLVSHQALISQIMSSHYQACSRMGEEQTRQIQLIHNDFDHYFSQVEGYMNEKMEKRLAPIQAKMEAVKAQISKVKKDTFNTEKEKTDKSEVQSMTITSKTEEDLIKRLEDTFKQKSNEKLQALQQCQQNLEQCVSVLEGMKRDFQRKVEEYQKTLAQMDAKQKDKITKESAKQQKEIAQLQQKLKETVKRAADVQRQTAKSSVTMKEQLNAVLVDNQHLRTTVVSTNAVETSIDTMKQLNDEKERLIQLTRQRESHENLLTDARTRNESLKREIARMKHEIKVKKHRESFL